MPPKPTKTNWEAVGAVAGVVGVLLALLTLAATVPGGSTPNPYPAPANSRTSTYKPQPPFPTSNQPGGEPPGCQQGKATVTTYEEATPVPGPYPKANAAQRAITGIQEAMNSGASGIVLTDLRILYNDFGPLLGSADNPYYNTADAAIHTDSQQLWKDCGAG